MRILLFCYLLMIGGQVCSNEINSRFGDRSWQFNTPNDEIAKQNNLVLYCQQNPKNCNQQQTTPTDNNRSITPPSNNGNSNGANLNLGGGDSIIGNNITVVIEGDGNVVEISGDQSLIDSPQTIDHNVSDNNLTIVDTPSTNEESDQTQTR